MIEKLKRFCGHRENPRIATPWSIGDRTYATTGYILVVIPRDSEVPERRDTIDLTKVLAINPMPEDGWVEAPAIEGLSAPECPHCKGKVRESWPCEECDGDGMVEFSNAWHSYEIECKGCGGYGQRGGCRECGGTGYLTEDLRIHIAGAEFKTEQILDLTRTFGPLQVAPPHPEGKASWIRFDGGHALVMPLTRAQSA